ncbi:hypothetical protein [Halorubrum halophilum]|uniref:hypothetical protein n=1 Tax=Halorubrum halophilum TaxID=413816 RepID=UPI0006791B17|nr:hypothetical protein [Halorubrum halophilum]
MASPIHIVGGVAAALGANELYKRWKYSPHDRYVLKTHKKIADAMGADASVFVDLPGRGIGGTRGVVDDLGDLKPDLIVSDFPDNFIIEVEGEEGLRNRDHVVNQLNDYRANGYSRALVVPDDDDNIAIAEEYADAAEGTVNVETPISLGNSLL